MGTEIVVVGAGPAGLGFAIEAAMRGYEVLVLERQPGPPDKACGEGLMPAGVRWLERLGALPHVPAADRAFFDGVVYRQEDGTEAPLRLRRRPGMAIRRLALARALTAAAREAGVDVRFGCTVRGVTDSPAGAEVAGDVVAEGRLVVLADGLNSGLRQKLGLEGTAPTRRRFGLRRHFATAPWSRFVEVHWSEGLEAYVTPVGEHRVGVAVLFDKDRVPPPHQFEALLARFPALAERLGGAPPESEVLGAGPFSQRARARVDGRVVLLGDAAASVDPVAGEGMRLAWDSAFALAQALPRALSRDRDVSARALADFERTCARGLVRPAMLARALVELSARPAVRRRVLRQLGKHPDASALVYNQLA